MDDPEPDHVELTAPERGPASPDLLDERALPLLGLSWGTLLAIFVGGGLGTVARYLLEVGHPAGTTGFPWVTLGVNLSGSFAIGAVIVCAARESRVGSLLRPLVVVGFLGGWTTYSTFAVETLELGIHHRAALGLWYVVVTLVGGTALVVLGHALGRRLVAR
jgi:CrcB protein